MKLGLSLGYWGSTPPTHHVGMAQKAEALGYDSVWTAGLESPPTVVVDSGLHVNDFIKRNHGGGRWIDLTLIRTP